MPQFHHGISKKEPASGIIPMRDAETNTIALLAFSDDADPNIFPVNTPVLVTSINRALAASGTEGNLRASLETIAAITNPTLIVVRIEDPFTDEVFNQSKVIGSTLPTGQRTGLQAFLTAKSILGLTPKILIAPDVETPEVVQTLASICKKLRAYSYITPRDQFGVMLETMEQVVAYRDTLGFREIEIVWPEWTSENVFLGKLQAHSKISCAGASSYAVIDYDSNLHYKITINNEVVLDLNKIDLNSSGEPELNPHLQKLLNLVYLQGVMTGWTESLGALEFRTISYNDNLRISVEAFNVIGLDGGGQVNHPAPIFLPRPQESNNQTLTYENQDAEGGYSKVSFCLSSPV